MTKALFTAGSSGYTRGAALTAFFIIWLCSPILLSSTPGSDIYLSKQSITTTASQFFLWELINAPENLAIILVTEHPGWLHSPFHKNLFLVATYGITLMSGFLLFSWLRHHGQNGFHIWAPAAVEPAGPMLQSRENLFSHLPPFLRNAPSPMEPQYRQTLDAASVCIVAIDENDRIQAFNQAAENLFGYRAVEVIGKPISFLMPDPEGCDLKGCMIHYLDDVGETIVSAGPEYVGRRKNGDRFPLELIVRETTVDGTTQYTGVIRDITFEADEARERLIKLLKT